MPTYTFECPACNEYYEEFFHIDECPSAIPCTCGEYANKIINYAPALGKGTNDGNFKPYFDEQLNQHFQSADEKRTWLKTNDYVQVSGSTSPTTSKPGNFHCTQHQASTLKRPD